MTDALNKILQIGLFVILAVSMVLFVVFYVNGESMTTTVINWAYILMALTLALLVFFPIRFFIKHPKSGIRFLVILAGFGILYGISYAMASDATAAAIYEKNNITANISRAIGAGMIMTYILIGISILSLIVTGITKIFK